MFKLKLFRRAICFFLVLLFITALCTSFSFAENIQSTSSMTEQELIEKHNQLNKSLQDAQKNALDVQSQLSIYAEKVFVVQQQIDQTSEKIRNLNTQIAQKEAQLLQLQRDTDENMKQLEKLVRAVYMSGDSQDIEIMLDSNSFLDLFDRIEFISRAWNYYKGIADTINSQIDVAEKEKAYLIDMRYEVSKSKELLDTQQSELTTALSQQQQLLSNYTGQTSLYQDALDQNNLELQQINSELANYYKNASSVNSQSGTTSNNDSETFIWPVPGFDYISSYWDDGRNHKGIDIAGAGIYGADIVASKSGTVIKTNTSGYGGGYGYYVVIDHGNGYATLYGHMSKVAVDEGDYVAQGTTIGYVGSTGDSTGPHLHFEIRYNSEQQNPLDYL